LDKNTTIERTRAALEGLAFEDRASRDGTFAIGVKRDVLHEALLRLRDRAGFVSVTFVTAVDRYPGKPRYELHHQLMSKDAERVRVTTELGERDASAPTCVDIWPGASFMERECYDMFGIVFDGHPDLRRLLMPEGYDHHPLRKDFPHAGIEPDRLYREWDRERRKHWDPSSSSGGAR